MLPKMELATNGHQAIVANYFLNLLFSNISVKICCSARSIGACLSNILDSHQKCQHLSQKIFHLLQTASFRHLSGFFRGSKRPLLGVHETFSTTSQRPFRLLFPWVSTASARRHGSLPIRPYTRIPFPPSFRERRRLASSEEFTVQHTTGLPCTLSR